MLKHTRDVLISTLKDILFQKYLVYIIYYRAPIHNKSWISYFNSLDQTKNDFINMLNCYYIIPKFDLFKERVQFIKRLRDEVLENTKCGLSLLSVRDFSFFLVDKKRHR